MSEKRWISEWFGQKHYKRSRCDCGKEHWIEVPFLSSGHDDWDGRWIKHDEKDKIKDAIKSIDSLVNSSQ